MNGLIEAMASVTGELSVAEDAREAAISHSRRAIRLTKNVIHGIHASTEYSEYSTDLENEMRVLIDLSDDPLVLTSGPVQDAMGEYAEARLFEAMMLGKDVPSNEDLRIPAGAWVLGLADTLGELRRAVMTCLMDEDMDRAMELFGIMEDVHEQIMLLDVPDAVVPIRRKQDIARGIMDRTRSDMTTASIMRIGKD